MRPLRSLTSYKRARAKVRTEDFRLLPALPPTLPRLAPKDHIRVRHHGRFHSYITLASQVTNFPWVFPGGDAFLPSVANMAQPKSLRLISSLRERAPVPALGKVSLINAATPGTRSSISHQQQPRSSKHLKTRIGRAGRLAHSLDTL